MLAKTLIVRATSRRFATSTGLMRSSVQRLQAVQSNSMFSLGARMMSSKIASVEKAAQKLTKALDKEVKYENENYSQLEDIDTFLNQSGFQFTDEPNGITMILSKEVGGKTIEVHFDARYVFLDLYVANLILY
jgi:hypothetical protein